MANFKAMSARAEVMSDLAYCRSLTDKGWVSVNYPHGYESRYHAIDIERWVREHLGEYWRFGRTFFFKDGKDASVFLLKYT